MATDVERVAVPLGASPVLAFTQLARGLAALAVGRHAEALDHLKRTFDPSDPAFHPFVSRFAIADLAEAAVGAERQAGSRRARSWPER